MKAVHLNVVESHGQWTFIRLYT